MACQADNILGEKILCSNSSEYPILADLGTLAKVEMKSCQIWGSVGNSYVETKSVVCTHCGYHLVVTVSRGFDYLQN